MNLNTEYYSFVNSFLLRITITSLSILILICYTTLPIYAQNSAEEYFYSGVEKANSGDYEGAIEDYNKAIEINPKDAEAYNNRGVAKWDLGDDRGAIEDYNKAIEIKPRYADAYSDRGVVKDKLGDYKGAIEDYNKAIEINPKYSKAYNNRGVANEQRIFHLFLRTSFC